MTIKTKIIKPIELVSFEDCSIVYMRIVAGAKADGTCIGSPTWYTLDTTSGGWLVLSSGRQFINWDELEAYRQADLILLASKRGV